MLGDTLQCSREVRLAKNVTDFEGSSVREKNSCSRRKLCELLLINLYEVTERQRQYESFFGQFDCGLKHL
jgi:hypothetical protein